MLHIEVVELDKVYVDTKYGDIKLLDKLGNSVTILLSDMAGLMWFYGKLRDALEDKWQENK